MLFFADDEQDKDPDEEEADAASDEDSENEGEEDEGEDHDDSEDDEDDSDEEADSADDEDDDNKPVTRKELRELLKGNKNNRNASRRVSQKNNKGRDTRQPSESDKRIADLENFKKQTEIANKKLDFATENGLSRKQTNYVFKLTKRPTVKFLNKPHVKVALDAIKAQEGVARNTPSGSGKRFNAPGNKKWTELKPEERQSNFAALRRSILSNKR